PSDLHLMRPSRLAHASRVSGVAMAVGKSVLWLFGFTIYLTLAFTDVGARADHRNAAVLLDSWWSGEYAKKALHQPTSFTDDDTMSRIRNFGCGAGTGCPEAMAKVTACTSGGDAKMQASRFEDRLMTQFAVNPACKGAAFGRYHGPDGPQPSAADETLT